MRASWLPLIDVSAPVREEVNVLSADEVTVTAVSCAACVLSAKSMDAVWPRLTEKPSRVTGAKPMRRAVTANPGPTSRLVMT